MPAYYNGYTGTYLLLIIMARERSNYLPIIMGIEEPPYRTLIVAVEIPPYVYIINIQRRASKTVCYNG
jgi:hypothetical protein